MDENEMLIESFKYNRKLAEKFSKEILYVIDRHAAMFIDKKDFSLISFDAAWDMVCHEACWPNDLKSEIESTLMLEGIYIIIFTSEVMYSIQSEMKEIETMAMFAMG